MSRISKEEYESSKDDRLLFGEHRKSNEDIIVKSFSYGFDEGFKYALESFAIWKDGVQRIGCLDTPIKEILEGIRKG